MEIVIWLLVVLLAAVPAGILTTFAVVWHERRRVPEPPQRPAPTVDTPIFIP
ncbi:MAG TPA: hypothetical protein VIW24_00970 [Aldersonia sp.]